MQLSYTTITAPFDGAMSAHLVDPGAMVGAGLESPFEEWRKRLLLRDHEMVRALKKEGPRATLLAFVHPWTAKEPKLRTAGTEYTMTQAREAGVTVIEAVCPAWFAPT